MKNTLSFIFLVQAFSLIDIVQAQTIDAKKWNIHDCFEYATANNIEVNTLRLSEAYSIQSLYAAKGEKIPSLSGLISTSFNNGNNDVLGNGKFVNQLNNTGSYSLNSAIVLWNGNFINNNIKQNDLLVQLAGLSVNQSVNNITLQITQAFLNILLAKANLKYVEDLVITSEALVKQSNLLYNAGSVAKINLLQLQAQFASDKFLLIQTQNDIKQNVLLLKQLLQLPSSNLFDIEVPTNIDIAGSLALLHDVQVHAIANFPEIKIGKLDIDIATLDIDKAKAGFKPVITANASIGSGYSNMLTNVYYSKTDYFVQTGNNFYQRLGISLTIPIFSNRINKTNLAKANIGYSQAKLNLQNYQLILSQAIEQIYLSALNAQQSYVAANEQLIAATESYRIIQAQFKLGGTNTYEVLQLRNQYVQSIQAYTQTKYTAVLQQKIYEFYLGKPITF